jgi:hypothetical protein
MRTLICSILASFMLFAGCTTQKKCLLKFPPVKSLVDSVYVHDTVWFDSEVITLPADTLVVVDSVWCQDNEVFIQRIEAVGGERTAAVSSLDRNLLTTRILTDGLSVEIENLRRELRTIERHRNEQVVVEVPVEVRKRYIPKWVWGLLAFSGLQLLWATRKIWAKF